ncbi:hypothetical protein CPT06_12310 [Bacillus vallismortis]|nr:hypothetical protein CPT06_12310 [Bacillus vallismortis]
MNDLPNIDNMTTVEAIHWYTGEVAKVTSREARINGTYSEDYLKALNEWKLSLNERCKLERTL